MLNSAPKLGGAELRESLLFLQRTLTNLLSVTDLLRRLEDSLRQTTSSALLLPHANVYLDKFGEEQVYNFRASIGLTQPSLVSRNVVLYKSGA